MTRVAVVFDARVDVEVVADHVAAGRHFGLLTSDHFRNEKKKKLKKSLPNIELQSTPSV